MIEALGDCVKIIKGNKVIDVINNNVPGAKRYIQIEDLRSDQQLKYSRDKNGVDAKITDILIAWDGANAGTVGFNIEGLIGSTIAILRPINKNIYPPYLGYYLRGKFNEIQENTTGATIPHINRFHLENLKINFPSLIEQEKIVAILQKADRLRRLRRYARELSDGYLQSVFLEMFGDPETNPMGWDIHYLSDLCLPKNGIKAGPFGSSLKKEFYSQDGYRIYGQEQVIGGNFQIGDYYISNEMFENKFKQYKVKPNDILISLVGSFGRTIIVPQGIQPGIINPRLLKISLQPEKITPIFLSQYLKLSIVQNQLLNLSHGGTMGILNAGQLKEIKILCPPIKKQKDFEVTCNAFEQLRRKTVESSRQAEQLFQALLRQAFE